MHSMARNDVKQLAAQIEVLAKRVQDELDNDGDFLATANELVRNSSTMVFSLGGVYAIEHRQLHTLLKKVNKTSTPSHTNRVYHRDALGRFSRK